MDDPLSTYKQSYKGTVKQLIQPEIPIYLRAWAPSPNTQNLNKCAKGDFLHKKFSTLSSATLSYKERIYVRAELSI